ncbi:putative hydrolase [Helianthus annuus]|nr:putative hydrolase [Helianthus annuus]KAJ0901283.1 putative hydrolase [Helianthus annuus]
MVFSGIKEAFSSIASRFSSPKLFSSPYASSELPPLSGSTRGFGFSGSKYKNSLRLSSSLQDFSKYNQLDPEEGNLNPQLSRENGGSTFAKDRSPPRATVKRKWVRPATVLLCVLLLTCIVYGFLHLYSNWSQQSTRFFVVLDCGSTGTRVFVYQASVNHRKDGNLPILLKSLPEDPKTRPSSQSGRAYNRKETEPGFDKLVRNVTGLTQAINPLLGWAEKQIPKHAHKTTSLFLYATAGVRRLPTGDSDWILNNAWSIMKKSSFVCKREWVKIISGTEEAYYGWIALNYHTRMLGANPKKQTYGALDLGGSSLQVTFESHDRANNETSLDINIGTVNHHLSGYSLAGYGLNDAFDKSVVYLLKTSRDVTKTDITEGKAVVKHPCLQTGYNENYVCPMCQSVFQDVKSPKRGIPVRLTGAPNGDECSKLARISVNSSEWSDKSKPIDCGLNPCALQDDLPRPRGQFYAMSGFFVVYRFFNLSGDAPLDEVLRKGREFCEKTWDVAKVSVPAQPFIEQYCFRAPYVVLLLKEGLHIKDSQVNIGSGGITWTTGVALLEGGKVISSKVGGYSYKLFQIEIHPFILSAILVVSLGLLVCALARVGRCFPRVFRRHRNASGTPSPFSRSWSPIISGEGRMKMPLSPVARTQKRPFGSDIQIAESALYASSSSGGSSITHSISSSNLGQMQFDSAFYPAPHRSQMRLQSRRSQSREDLISSLSDPTHI